MLKDVITETLNSTSKNTHVFMAPHQIGNEELKVYLTSKGVKTGRNRDLTAEGITEVSGVSQRYSMQPLGEEPADFKDAVSHMASNAATGVLKSNGWRPAQIDTLVFASTYPTGEQVSQVVADRLQARNAKTLDVYAACAGGSLSVEEAIAISNPGERILIVSAEHYSSKMGDDLNKTIFSDGAAAFAFRNEVDFELMFADNAIDFNSAIKLPIEEDKIPDNSLFLTVSNHTPVVAMNGRKVLKWVGDKTPFEMTTDAYQKVECEPGTKYIIHHPGSGRAAEIFEKKLRNYCPGAEIPASVVSQVGNPGAASIFIELDNLMQTRRVKKGDIIIFSGFGAGGIVNVTVLQAKKDIN